MLCGSCAVPDLVCAENHPLVMQNPLLMEPETLLSQLGITSGDLLWVLSAPEGTAAELAAQSAESKGAGSKRPCPPLPTFPDQGSTGPSTPSVAVAGAPAISSGWGKQPGGMDVDTIPFPRARPEDFEGMDVDEMEEDLEGTAVATVQVGLLQSPEGGKL